MNYINKVDKRIIPHSDRNRYYNIKSTITNVAKSVKKNIDKYTIKKLTK